MQSAIRFYAKHLKALQDFFYFLLKDVRHEFEDACEQAPNAEVKDTKGIKAYQEDVGIDTYVGSIQSSIKQGS